MYCKNCGSAIGEGSKFCNVCGTSLISDVYSENREEALLRAYVGKNYDKLLSEKFNFYAWFLNLFYFAYRKVWLCFFGLFFIFGVCNVFLLEFSNIIVGIIVIVGASYFNKYYIDKARKDVEYILIKNDGQSMDELLKIAAKKGGVSGFNVVLAFISMFILALIISFFNFSGLKYTTCSFNEEGFSLDINVIFYEDNAYKINYEFDFDVSSYDAEMRDIFVDLLEMSYADYNDMEGVSLFISEVGESALINIDINYEVISDNDLSSVAGDIDFESVDKFRISSIASGGSCTFE